MAEHEGPSQRTAEALTALAMALFGAVAVWGSLAVGIGWGDEGPKSGFFPFYIGLALILASVVNLLSALRVPGGPVFAEWGQIRRVVAVVIPTAIYVAAIPWVGLYVASVVLIAGFMMWLGRYNAFYAVGIAVAVMAITFVTFERWFLVPLPKGPLEDWLGL